MEEFLKACGATGALQLVIENRGLVAMRWGAHQPFALIGRDPAADVSLDHPRVDPFHAYLQVIDGDVYWVDLGSQFGTQWQNVTARFGWLVPPHGIGIGPYVIRLASDDRGGEGGGRRPDHPPDPLASRSNAPDDLPRIMLEFRQESSRPVRWRMRHLLTLLGSSAFCKVRLSSPGVRPFHCSLLRTAAGLWMVNLIGPGGVEVNGSSVHAARLQDGDELRIADVLIRVLSLDAEGGTPALEGPVRKALAGPSTPTAPATGLASRRPQSALMAPGPEVGGPIPGRDRAQAQGPSPGPIPVQVQVQGAAPGEGEIPASVLALVLDQFGQMQQQFLDQFQQTTLMMFRALGSMHRDQMEELREKLDSLHQIGENLQAFQEQLEGGAAAGALPAAASASPPDGAPAGPAPGPPPGAAANGVEQLREKVRSIVDQPGIPGEDVHEWLIGRIAAIEDEQRTRWQKILDMMRGR